MTVDRSDLLGRLVPSPGPTSPAAIATWDRLDEPARRALRRAAADEEAASTITDAARRRVVRELAAGRATARRLDRLAPVATGLLVLSTLWGFGRAVFPADGPTWLVAGLVGLAVTTATGLRRVTARRRAARAVLRALDERPGRPSGPGGP